MSSKSNDQGRAYEYIMLVKLAEAIGELREVRVIENSSFEASKSAWEQVDEKMQSTLTVSAKAIIPTMFELEPLILEKDGDELELMIQPDNAGKGGDVRDILLVRSGIKWEVGLSMKHNHFAVKHSRLSHVLDFGEKWYGHQCSKEYWNEVSPIFDRLKELKVHNVKWEDISDKEEGVYVPLLEAFRKEIERSNAIYGDVSMKMVEYLLGEYDFYKVVSVDGRAYTQVSAFNLRGTLHNGSKVTKVKHHIPIVELPTKIIATSFADNSKTTIEIYMNKGWQFSFRIHNAETIVSPSLKFDIQIVGMPTTIVTINCVWKQ